MLQNFIFSISLKLFIDFCFIFNEYHKIKCFKKSVVGYIVGWTPEFFSCLGYIVGWMPEYFGCLGYIVGCTPDFCSCLGYIVSCGYPTRTHTHTRGNSVAHVWQYSYKFELLSIFNLKINKYKQNFEVYNLTKSVTCIGFQRDHSSH